MHIAARAKGLSLRRFILIQSTGLLSHIFHFFGNFRVRHGMPIGVDDAIFKADLLRADIVFLCHGRRDGIAQGFCCIA